jgi:general secretion pathway protein E
MAQRLVRTLCHECKVPMTLTAAESELLGLDCGDDRVAYQPVGCRRCKGTGFRGRRGLYELIMIDDTLRGMIHDGVKEQTMEAWCRERAPGMFQDGVEQILAGATSLAEVLRVTRAS